MSRSSSMIDDGWSLINNGWRWWWWWWWQFTFFTEVQVPCGLLLVRQLKDGFHHQGAPHDHDHDVDDHHDDHGDDISYERALRVWLYSDFGFWNLFLVISTTYVLSFLHRITLIKQAYGYASKKSNSIALDYEISKFINENCYCKILLLFNAKHILYPQSDSRYGWKRSKTLCTVWLLGRAKNFQLC